MSIWEIHEGVYGGLDIKKLKIDQAFLTVYSSLKQNVTVYTLSDDCDKCSPTSRFTLPDDGYSKQTTEVDCKYPMDIFVTNGSSEIYKSDKLLCRISEFFGEFGIYKMNITTDLDTPCLITTKKEPVNIYLPLLVCLLFYVLLAFVWLVGAHIIRRYRSTKNYDFKSQDSVEKGPGQKPASPQNMTSIHTFRGIAIILLVFVNMGGGQYVFFGHATWNGLLMADLAFPWLLWIMGMCIPIALKCMLKNSKPTAIFRCILKRFIHIFFIGVIASSFMGKPDNNHLRNVRIFGVLQRLSFCYFVVANIMLIFRNWFFKEFEKSKWTWLNDVWRLLPQWIVILFLTTIKMALTFFLPVPGCPTGYLGPGGRHENGAHANCPGGAAGYIDRFFMTTNHLYQQSSIKEVYGTQVPYDPEGVLGTLTTFLQVFLGVQAGSTFLSFADPRPRLIRWSFWGAMTGALGALLCEGSTNNGWIPLNKNLWSLSYVLVTSSFAFFLLSFCYVIIEDRKWWNGAPFIYPGMNAILVFAGHNMSYSIFPFTWQVQDMETHTIQLITNLWSASLWVIITVWFYRINFFLL